MFIVIVTPVAVVIFDFYDIKFEVYGNYLFWFIAMALFNALLPMEKKSIFDIKEVVANVTAASTAATVTKGSVSLIVPPVLVSSTSNQINPTKTVENNTYAAVAKITR